MNYEKISILKFDLVAITSYSPINRMETEKNKDNFQPGQEHMSFEPSTYRIKIEGAITT